MKKFLLFFAVAVLTVVSLAAQASAFSLGVSNTGVEMKFYDWTIGRQYTYDAGSNTWVSEGARAGLAGGNQNLVNGVLTAADEVTDTWSLINITSMNDSKGNSLWSNIGNEQISGYMSGGNDVYITQTSTGIDIGTVGTFMYLYLSNTAMDASAALPTAANMALLGSGSDPWSATDGSLFLILQAVPGVFGNTVDLYETVNGLSSPFTGTGSAYWKVVGGDYASLFDTNTYLGGAADMYGLFNFSPVGKFDFDSKSSDPTYGYVPEPSSILLLGFGLLGLVGLARRRSEG